ncbi:TauD/TfdA family dioxygenase [Pelagibius sp. Alg239-R121]|uniref:TauD/TfdA dioxygenase family protein n=1 Tax=Pelagibius sp. Alg239-R121 TaxID=2993448 RepID=UPI0024A64A37|nr:TauD/TfdA family dioxygenase [Pelagibius sp. Alg239-R121]
MPSPIFTFHPLEHASFGILADFTAQSPATAIDTFIAAGEEIRTRFNAAGGLMLVRGLHALEQMPEEFVRLSRVFGPEVENYHETLTSPRFFHETVPEILVLSNLPPCNHPPPPKPTGSESEGLPVQFPQQKNWHTDQSYRRPPPDITLLYGVTTPRRDQGQTLYADCTAAYAALNPALKEKIQHLSGIHAPSWIGRTPDDVRAGVQPKDLLPHQQPQRQPLIRFHPDTGKPAVYICEEKQMDFVEGPIAGLEPGPEGEGAELLRSLLRHVTGPDFTYVHEWAPGDLVIGDNRSLLHAATWYDADCYPRLMWRTTVMGNPGTEYAGEAKSWIPPEGYRLMEGMEDA